MWDSREEMTSSRWIKAHTAESIFETDMIKGALDREGIQYVVKEHKDTAYDGLFILQKGYASFFVEEKDEPTVMTIIRRIKSLPHVVYTED